MTPEEKDKDIEHFENLYMMQVSTVNELVYKVKEKDKEIETCITRLDLKEEKIKQLRDEIAALKSEIENERWIPVSERLPEEGDADENG